MTAQTKIAAKDSNETALISHPTLDKTRSALTQQVTDVLTERIVSAEYAEGSLLPSERQLCESLGVSRTVIREAIKSLESRRLVRIARGRGTIVEEPQYGALTDAFKILVRRRVHMLEDLLDLRKVLEVHMAMRAAERRTEANLLAMGAQIMKMRRMPNKPEGYINADVEFHMEIARATHNPIFMVLLASVSDLSRESRKTSFLGPKMVKLRADQHEEVLEYIRQQDPEGARVAMSKHLADTERDIHIRASSKGRAAESNWD